MAVFAFGFISCDKKKSDGKIVLTVWESAGGPDEFIKKAGEVYSKEHPNIEIKYVNVELGDSIGQIALDGPAGKGPDVFAGAHDRLSSLVAGGHILPTSDPGLIKENALASCAKAITYNDVMYGYPVAAETVALFYNRDLIGESEVPKTWDELKSFAEKFSAQDKNSGKYPFVMNVGEGYYTVIFTTENGNRLFGANGTDRKNSYINTPDSVKGMKFFQSLRGILDVPSSDLDTATTDAVFQSGEAALHISGPWNIKAFSDAGINFGVAPLPSLPGSDVPASSFSGTRTMFVSAYSEHPDEANDFAKFLMSKEMQMLRFECTGALPSVDVGVESPYLKGFLEQLNYAFPMPSIPEMATYWEAMNNASKNIWNGADVQTELDMCNASIVGK